MLDELRRRREALRGLSPPPPSEPAPEPEDVRAGRALRRFLAGIPISRDLSGDELRQAEALAIAWVQAIRRRDKVARRKQRRLERGGEWPED